jgi:transcriptional regulator with XRE-family HTH domain/SpoVK/Ycf46/Vps4 family AAA+-type ATPase
MPVQSRRLSEAGIKVLQQAIKRSDWTQQQLADEVKISRDTVSRVLRGEGVRVETIEDLCHLLQIEVVQVLEPIASSDDLETLVKRLRSQGSASIQKRCGEMRVLDMTTPIGLGSIYTDVNILERLASKTRREMGELMDCGPEEFDRFGLGKVREKRVDGLEAVERVRQLMILGRPGAGKTTFMKRLATVCNDGEFLAGQVPIFVTLKEWAETTGKPGLLEFLGQSSSEKIREIRQVFDKGRGLILLDGLDEVLEVDHDRILSTIRDFAFIHGDNNIVITCRIAAREYIFPQFTEVEVADFSDEQIQEFANRWFLVREPEAVDDEGRSTVGQLFWDALSDRDPVKELAANPLLLTLLCLEFENSAEFPKSRAELYERGLHVLLSKWDGQRRIRRDSAYGKLSVKRKESLLAQLAIATFSRGEYFFKERVAIQEIGKYIENLPDARSDEDLLVDSRLVLRDIVAQHGLLTERATGIYSFSHLTFHEYFVARSIVDISNPVKYEAALSLLMEHVADKRWREVFLLVVERSDDASELLMKMKRIIDMSLAQNEKLTTFLKWVDIKAIESLKYQSNWNILRARIFYFTLILTYEAGLFYPDEIPHLSELCSVNMQVDESIFELDRNLYELLNLSQCSSFSPSDAFHEDIDDFLSRYAVQNPVYGEFQKVKQFLAELISQEEEDFLETWTKLRSDAMKMVRNILNTYFNLGISWNFTDEELIQLEDEYYYSNCLLMECLNSESYVSREVRKLIEDTLLFPPGGDPLSPIVEGDKRIEKGEF